MSNPPQSSVTDTGTVVTLDNREPFIANSPPTQPTASNSTPQAESSANPPLQESQEVSLSPATPSPRRWRRSSPSPHPVASGSGTTHDDEPSPSSTQQAPPGPAAGVDRGLPSSSQPTRPAHPVHPTQHPTANNTANNILMSKEAELLQQLLDAVKESTAAVSKALSIAVPKEDAEKQNHLILEKILDTLNKSTIANKDAPDTRSRFWNVYKSEAEEFDKELVDKHGSGLDSSLIFSGLFLSVCGTFATALLSDLKRSSPVDDTTQALLQMMFLALANTTTTTPLPISLLSTPASANPSNTVIWTQSLLYGSLTFTLFATLGAVLGKQWLGQYQKVGMRGTTEDRGKERQRKLEALKWWRFDPVMGSLPFLLQLSLFLFAGGLSAHLITQQWIVGLVFAATTGAGALVYLVFTAISLVNPDCPYRTPLTTIISTLVSPLTSMVTSWARYGLWRRTRPFLARFGEALYLILMITLLSPIVALLFLLLLVESLVTQVRSTYWDPGSEFVVLVIRDLVFESLLKLLEAVVHFLSSKIWPSIPKIWSFFFPSPPSQPSSRAASWVIETSDDPLVQLDAARYIWDVECPTDFDTALFDRLLEAFLLSFHRGVALPSGPRADEQERAVLLGKVFLLVYWSEQRRAPDRVLTWRLLQPRSKPGSYCFEDSAIQGRVEANEELCYVWELIKRTFSFHWSRADLRLTNKVRVGWITYKHPSTLSNSSFPTLVSHIIDETNKNFKLGEGLLHRILATLPQNINLADWIDRSMSRGDGDVQMTLTRLSDDIDGRRTRITVELSAALITWIFRLKETSPPTDLSHMVRGSPGYWVIILSPFVGHCCRVNHETRRQMRKELVAEWCLDSCQRAYSDGGAGTEERIPVLKHAQISAFLQLAVSILCDGNETRELQGDLLDDLVSSSLSLPDSTRTSLIPHLPWIWHHVANRPTEYPAELLDPDSRLSSVADRCFRDGVGCGLWTLNQVLPFDNFATLARIGTNTPTFGVALPRMMAEIPGDYEIRKLSLLFASAVLNWARQSGDVGRIRSVVSALVNSDWADLMQSAYQVGADELQYVISFLASSGGQHDGIDRFFYGVGQILSSLHRNARPCSSLPDAFWSISLALVRIFDGSNPKLNPSVVDSARTALDPENQLCLACAAWRLARNGQVKMSPTLIQWILDSLRNVSYRPYSSSQCCVRNAIRADSELNAMAGGDQDLRTQLENVQTAFQKYLKS